MPPRLLLALAVAIVLIGLLGIAAVMLVRRHRLLDKLLAFAAALILLAAIGWVLFIWPAYWD